MKRLTVTVVALFAVFAVGYASMAAGAPNGVANKLVKTTLSLGYNPGSTDPYADNYKEAKFSGRAKTKKVCRADRKVVITDVGKAKTDRKGRYVISAGSGAPKGTYQASVKKKVVKQKNGVKVICKKAKSPKLKVS